MKRVLIRSAIYVGGMLVILFLTATHFDATELVACAMFAALVALTEAILRSTDNGNR